MCFHALWKQKHYALLFILSRASAVAGLPLTASFLQRKLYNILCTALYAYILQAHHDDKGDGIYSLSCDACG